MFDASLRPTDREPVGRWIGIREGAIRRVIRSEISPTKMKGQSRAHDQEQEKRAREGLYQAGQRDYPARTCRYAFFGDDFKQFYLCCVFQVGSTTQLLTEFSHADHSNRVRVFLTEQHHRTLLTSL